MAEAGFRRLPGRRVLASVIGGVGFATVGLLVPRALGVGYDGITDILTDRLPIAAAGALAAAQLVRAAVAD